MKLSHYQANGFYPVSLVAPDAVIELPAAAVSITKGDYIISNGSGYATNTATDTSALFFGIAMESVDNSAGSAGDLNVKVIRAAECANVRFSVPVGTNAVITRAYVGLLVDLHTNSEIDISDTTIGTGTFAFWIEDFDASADAVDGNTYGYAIGSFRVGAP